MSRRSLAVLLAALIAPASFAAAQRTFVSTAGLDTNPCSRPQPCRTFGAAIAQTAPGGEVYVLDSGGYGPTVIQSAISIRAEGVSAGVSVASGIGIDVSAGPSDVVTLSGLSINGVGGTTGVAFHSGAALHLERLNLAHFVQTGIFVLAAGDVTISDSILRDNQGSYGLEVQPPLGGANVSVDRTRFENNGTGVLVMESGRVIVHDSVASGNGIGFWAAVAGYYAAELTLEDCVVTENSTGIDSERSGAGPHVPTIRMSNVTVSRNGKGLVVVSGGAIVSFADNQVYGNSIDGAPTATIAQQ